MTILCAMIKFIGKLLLGIAYAILKVVSFSVKVIGCMFLFVFHIFLLLVDMGTPNKSRRVQLWLFVKFVAEKCWNMWVVK